MAPLETPNPVEKVKNSTENKSEETKKRLKFPKKSDYKSQEEFQKEMNKYYKENGLKQEKDFSENEKKDITDSTLKLISPVVLSQKYKTSIFVIKKIVTKAGLICAPNDLSKFPDFPKKSDEMTQEQHQKAIREFWKVRRKNTRVYIIGWL